MVNGNKRSWQNLMIAANQNLKERDYWLKKLSGNWVRTGFFQDGDIKGINDGNMEEVTFTLPAELSPGLVNLSNHSDIRLYIILLSGLYVLLFKYTGNKDIIIGSPVYRQNTGVDLINTVLPLRLEIEKNMTVKQLILEVRKIVSEGNENYSYPVELLPGQLNLPSPGYGFPLFDPAILLENIHDKRYLENINPGTIFSFLREDQRIAGTVEYNPSLYTQANIKKIINNYKKLLFEFMMNINTGISTVDILSGEEKRQVLFEFNQTAAAYRENITFHQLFEEQAEQNPDPVAVQFQNNSLTYGELNKRANRLARELRNRGVVQDKIIGIMIERSEKMITCVLAVLKAGSAYLPIDIEYPENRINYMLENCNAHLLLTRDHLCGPVTFAGEIIDIENSQNHKGKGENLACINKSTDLIYVIFTSGTTGNPKGVMVQHDQFVNAAYAWRDVYKLDKININLLQMAGFSFDVFAEDIGRALINRGKMIICSDRDRVDFDSLYSSIKRYRITLFESIPSLVIPFMDYVYENGWELENLQLLIIGADSCQAKDFKRLVSRFGKTMRILNSYGVTEATIDTCCCEYGAEEIKSRGVAPIGKPLANMRCCIVDNHNRLQPGGAAGELYIGGKGIARGYINSPGLTHRRFLPDPFISGRVYKTGDLARWLPDGNLEFLGRIDHQVKIRGYRIEPDEIKKQLLNYEGIKAAVVIGRKDKNDEKYLCAYIIPGKKIIISQLRKYLLSTLPGFMVPPYFVILEKFPLSANGKLDRNALPEPEFIRKPTISYITEEMLNQWAAPVEQQAKVREKPGESLIEEKSISAEEKKQVVYQFNQTARAYSRDQTIRELFEEQVEKTPDNTALVYESRYLSYSRLNKRANQLARVLRVNGVKAGSIVGIMAAPSPGMMIGILAILKAGAAFMPIGTAAPAELKTYFLEEARPRVLLVNNNRLVSKPAYPLTIIDVSNKENDLEDGSNLPAISAPFDISHVLYTSGSTGRPKGVMLENRSVVNLLKFVGDFISIRESDNVLSVTPITFDVFTEESILPLTAGAKVTIIREDAVDPGGMGFTIKKNTITILHSAPSAMQRFVLDVPEDAGSLKLLRCLLLAGEPLLDSQLELFRLNTGGKIYNLYGPTETTIYSTAKDVTTDTLSIGKPLNNTRIYILGTGSNPQPVGVIGELCVGGTGVARGYLNRPELSREKIIKNPFIQGDRVYRTGDLARWLPDGNIEFIGRLDHQVQLSGVRVEPGEIENCLLTYSGIKEAVVVVKENQNREKLLRACLTMEDRLEEHLLRTWLSEKLPHYMIPAQFFQLEKIPLTPNRKINRKLLAALEIEMGANTANYIAPGNPIEEKLVEIWAEVLVTQKELIGIDDNFFEIGGHSLKTTIMAAKIFKKFGVKLPLVEIFKSPNIRELAEFISSKKKEVEILKDENLILIKSGNNKKNHLFLVHDGSGEVEGYTNLCPSLDDNFYYWGIKADRIKNHTPYNVTIQEIAKKYINIIKKIQDDGPYNIAGWSLGGNIAFEMVRQIEQVNQKVKFFALIDSRPPAKELRQSTPFTLESELNFVLELFPDGEIKKNLTKVKNIDQIWPLVLDYFEKTNVDIEKLIASIPGNMIKAIPGYEQIKMRELIYYFNIIRTFRNAGDKYIPPDKIDTKIHFFIASQGDKSKRRGWEEHSKNSVQYYEITGDHFSIFNKPGVMEFAGKFNKVLNNPG